MVEIAKCRMCGGTPRAKIVLNEVVRPHYLSCANLDCGVDGPLRHTEAEAIRAWNALMSPASPEPAAGKVRVRIPVHDYGGDATIDCLILGNGSILDRLAGRGWAVVAYITADIPFRQPVEIPGTVESKS